MWHLMPYPGSVLLIMTITCRKGWPNLVLSLGHLLGQLCHLAPCLPQLAPAMHVMEVVLLFHLWWRSPVFPGNTKSQGGQVSLTGDWDGDQDGVLPNVFGSSGPFQQHGGVRMWPSFWILVPGFCSSRPLDLVAIDMKTVAVNWNSRWVHTTGCKGLCKKIRIQMGLQ